MKKNLLNLVLVVTSVCFLTVNANATIYIDPTTNNGSFETSSGGGTVWTLANNTVSSNYWAYWLLNNNNPWASVGTKSMYIRRPGNSSYLYDLTLTSANHFYQDIAINAADSLLSLTFNWKCNGELGVDYWQVSIVPTSVTPVAGTAPTGQLFSATQASFGGFNGGAVGMNGWMTASYNLPCNSAGTTIRLVFSWISNNLNGVNFPAAIDNVVLNGGATASCGGSLGTGVTAVGALPYSTGASSTAGAVDDLTVANVFACGNSTYLSGEDEVFWFTPAATGQIQINLTAGGATNTGIFLYKGCPLTSVCSNAGTCTGFIQNATGSGTLCASVVAGSPYYVVLDKAGGGSFAYTGFSISAPVSIPAGITCANPYVIAAFPFTANGESTTCMGNEYNNAVSGTCLSLYESGEDKVYQYTAAAAECLFFTLSGAGTTAVGIQIYLGEPGAGGTCISNFGGQNPLSAQVTLPVADTYFFMVDTWAPPTFINYNLSITSSGSGAANDDICNATTLTIGTATGSSNICSGSSLINGATETSGSCWSSDAINSVWFKFTAVSSSTKIETSPNTLTDTQLQVYVESSLGAGCGSVALVGGTNCSSISTTGACGSTASYASITVTTVAGWTYFVRVDGNMNTTGTFGITAYDNTTGTSTYTVQDCQGAIPICTSVYTSPTSYFGCGNVNEVPYAGTQNSNPSTNPGCPSNYGCLLAGPPELNSIWFTMTFATSGALAWTLTAPGGGYYDWELWNITSAGCAGIAAGTLAPTRCNWNGWSLGTSGMQCNGTTVSCDAAYCGSTNQVPGGATGNFQNPPAVAAGETYALCYSNWSYTSGGFTLDFTNTIASGATFAGGTSFVWTGVAGTTNWATSNNWDVCGAPPTCGTDATIVTAGVQPVLSSNQSVKNVTIAAGATLTINAGVTLTVCGNFTNNGTLIAAPTSTVLFTGPATQTITGNLTGANSFGNVTITKGAGSGNVTLANDIDIKGSFTTSNGTSILNANGKYIKLAGNFANNAGSTTFIGVAGSTLEFNGAANQNYTAGANTLVLNNVLMNQSAASSVTLTGGGGINMNISGTLTLTMGKIITNSYEVNVTNTATSAVSAGNANSYVEGNLRRALAGTTGSYDFPVGHTSKGYQRANLNFTSAPSSGDLLARFDPYGTVPLGPYGPDCPSGTGYVFDVISVLDNGYWTISGNPNPFTGSYNMTLYNTNYTNAAAIYTVVKSPGSSAPTAGSWVLDGTCVIGTPANATQRTGMAGFSTFGVGRSDTPLPIELVDFSGHPEGMINVLEWTTQSEVNNDFFLVERSKEGGLFEELAKVDGAGTSIQTLHYKTNDNYPFNGTNYYRLKQVDFDGRFTYSPVISINNHSQAITIDNLHPNPTSNSVSFDFSTPFSGEVTVEVIDMYGKVLFAKFIDAAEGKNTIDIDMIALSAGVYGIRVSFRTLNFSSINKVVKF